MLDMLQKQASQVKTAADQFRDLMHNLDKLAFKPDPFRRMEGMDPLLAVREYDSPVYVRHRTTPGGVDELLSEPPKKTVAETNRLTSEAQEPPQPSEDGNDSRSVAKDNKSLGTVGYTWEQNKKPETVPDLASMKVPGTGGTAAPQPSIPKSASRSRIQNVFDQDLMDLVKMGLAGPAPVMAGSPTMSPAMKNKPVIATTPTPDKGAQAPAKKKLPGWVLPAGIAAGALGVVGLGALAGRSARKSFAREFGGGGGGRAAAEHYTWNIGGKAGKGSWEDYTKARQAHQAERDTYWAGQKAKADADFAASREAHRKAYEEGRAAHQAKEKARSEQKTSWEDKWEDFNKRWGRGGSEWGERTHSGRAGGGQAGWGSGGAAVPHEADRVWEETRKATQEAANEAAKRGEAANRDMPTREEMAEAFRFYGLDLKTHKRADVIKKHKEIVKKYHTDKAGGGSREEVAKANTMFERLKKISSLKLVYDLGMVR